MMLAGFFDAEFDLTDITSDRIRISLFYLNSLESVKKMPHKSFVVSGIVKTVKDNKSNGGIFL